MAKRHADAIAIQGACNPSGVAISLVEAIREVHAEDRASPTPRGTIAVQEDHAVRLIVYQLAYLTGVTGGVANFAKGDWSYSYAECLRLGDVQSSAHNPNAVIDGVGYEDGR